MTTRIERIVRWFTPGLGVKRWLLLALVGAALLVNGIDRIVVAEGWHVEVNEAIDDLFENVLPLSWLAPIFVVAGAVGVFFGIRQWMRSIVGAIRPDGKDRIVDALLDLRLRRGYKIVAIGGGTGLSSLLRGLKRSTSNLTAIVTVTDDGGSSGRLQKELGMLPPGDIRNCLVALSDDEALVTELFRYRFTEGEGLAGHSFGNLFLAALTAITGNFDDAVKASSRVLNIKGRVLPSTLDSVRLRATLADGRTLVGESTISAAQGTIATIDFEPARPRAFAEAVAAIAEADAVVLGPGSLYTSILPNLLIEEIVRAIEHSHAVKIYVCNVMTQPGETTDFTASRHIEELFAHAGARIADTVIVNEEPPRRLRELYAEEGQVPVVVDRDRIEELGVRVIGASVISESVAVRHDPDRLAEVVLHAVDSYIAERSSFVRGPAAVIGRRSEPRA